MPTEPNPAAVALGKLRWAGTTQEERSEAMRRLVEQRKAVEDPARRAEIMRKANEARWGKRRKRRRKASARQ